jgi:hypothetical protein
MIITNFANVEPIQVFMMSVLVTLSFVLVDRMKSLCSVLLDRNVFILRGTTANFSDGRH